MNSRRSKTDRHADSLKAIGEALTRTYQDVVTEKIPQELISLLEKLDRNGPDVSRADASGQPPGKALLARPNGSDSKQ